MSASRVRSDSRKDRPKTLSAIRPVPRRGLSRVESAMYIGLSPSKFDEMLSDGRMPKPIVIDRRKVWDVRELDMAFDALRRESDDDLDGWKDFNVDKERRS